MDIEFKSQEELYKYIEQNDLIGLDSEYSKSTKELKEKFNANGVHLNRWWVMTPIHWRCPVCERNKSQIVRLNKHGDLSGQLHEHHDHMADLVKQRFQELSASKKVVVADTLAEKFAIRLSFALAAYDNTIICSDCNAADMEAKKVVKTHRYYSYAPSDIAKFIIIENNVEHKINEEIAKEIWEEEKDIFDLRMKFLDQIANTAALNTHWYKPSNQTAKQTSYIAKNFLESYGLTKLKRGWPESLLYETNKYSGNNSAWRYKKRIKKLQFPSNGEIQHMIKLNGKHWHRYDNDWRCPVCDQFKGDCIQKSNQGSWFFITVNKSFLSKNHINWCQNINICNECSKVATLIKKEVDIHKELEWSGHWFLKADELKQIVVPNKNASHQINNEYFEKLLPTLYQRIEEEYYTYSPYAPKEEEDNNKTFILFDKEDIF